MNNTRRKTISELSQKVATVKGEIEALMQEIEDVKSEEEEYKGRRLPPEMLKDFKCIFFSYKY